MNAAARGPAIVIALLISALPAAADDARAFPLKTGDTWVMAGDSITAQKLHSNYFEAFCYARYPKITFRFRNSGVGGDTIPKVLARYDWDVNAWKPSVVSVELGMNDQGGFTVEQYIANMKKLDERIRASGARPIYFTASPVNNGDTHAKIGGNAKLQKFAMALKEFADQQKAPFANQFDAVIDIWGQNKPKENVARLLPTVKAAARMRACRCRAPACLPRRAREIAGEARLHAGRPGPPRCPRATHDGGRTAEGAGRQSLCQQRRA